MERAKGPNCPRIRAPKDRRPRICHRESSLRRRPLRTISSQSPRFSTRWPQWSHRRCRQLSPSRQPSRRNRSKPMRLLRRLRSKSIKRHPSSSRRLKSAQIRCSRLQIRRFQPLPLHLRIRWRHQLRTRARALRLNPK